MPRERDRLARQVGSALTQTLSGKSPPMRSKRIGGQDLRAGRHVLSVDRQDLLRSLEQGTRAPERQATVDAATFEVGPHGRVEQERGSGRQALAELFGGLHMLNIHID